MPNPSDHQRPPMYRFGPFELDAHSGELRRDGRLVALQPQPAAVLAELAAHPGEVVARRDLERRLWGDDAFVDREQGLNFCVRQIRQALGDTARSSRYVETLPRRGYRFVAPVEVVRVKCANGDGSGTNAAPEAETGVAAARGGSSRRSRAVPRGPAAALLAATLVAATAWTLHRAQPDRAQPNGSARSAGTAGATAAPGERPILVVLPFRELGEASDAPEGEVFAEALISRLSQLDPQRLGVIALTTSLQYGGRHLTVSQIADELGASFVLEGSVRRSPERLRVSARLLSASDQTQRWARSYDRPSGQSVAVERELARQVARWLAERVPGLGADDERLAGDDHEPPPEAFEAYLQGMHLLDEKRSGAIVHLERAVELDPLFARAWVQLAEARRVRNESEHDDRRRWNEASRRALELAPRLPEAHLQRALGLMYLEWDFAAAGEHLERALELNPAYAQARHQYGTWLAIHGRTGEALAEVRRALELDPASLVLHGDLGWFRLFDRDYHGAVSHLEALLEVAPTDYWTRRGLLAAYLLADRHDDAAALAVDWPDHTAAPIAARAVDLGSAAVVNAFLRHEASSLRRQESEDARIAVDYALAGDVDRALHHLALAAERRGAWQLPFLAIDPRLDALRDDARFRDLVERVSVGAGG